MLILNLVLNLFTSKLANYSRLAIFLDSEVGEDGFFGYIIYLWIIKT